MEKEKEKKERGQQTGCNAYLFVILLSSGSGGTSEMYMML